MSKEYREETKIKYESQIKKILETSPAFVSDFYEHMHNGSREITTQAAYIRDIISFLNYIHDSIPSLNKTSLKSFPLEILDKLTVKDLNEYRAYLHDEKKLSNSSMKKKFAAISAFYKYINGTGEIDNNPMKNFELPAINAHKIIKLDSELSNKLLEGILKNDKYLSNTVYGEEPISIPENVAIKRDKLVLRNYAICCLFLGSGLRVSELVGLDLNDISFRQNSITIIAKGGDEIQVFFGEEVAKALKLYIDGSSLPKELIEKYKETEEDALFWCKQNMGKPNFSKRLRETFENRPAEFYRDMVYIASAMRRTGRNGFKHDKNNKAVFLSTHGNRMTVRMVELMIKEMVKTYLPEYDDKELFSPHKLRATCATRILTQTGDIQLASTQLNHKGVAVTAKFYAEIQKEQQKDKIKKLDIAEW